MSEKYPLETTLDEMIEAVQTIEAHTKESEQVKNLFANVSKSVIEASESGKVKILTDYDADGITSAYIMEKTIRAINPDCDVKVECNDRRGSYGLSPDIEGEVGTRHIVCDMGSNQLDFAREKLGKDVIIIDHHLIEDDKVRNQFINNISHLCNPHAFNKDDKKNAQYCTAGLAYRIYQNCKAIRDKENKPFEIDEKQENAVKALACIGTATDMVSVIDTNSLNRFIIREGVKVIDNADENNFDFIVGNLLARAKIDEKTTAYQLAFNVGALLNSASRMSDINNENGSQIMYDALTGDYSAKTFRTLDKLQAGNTQRKAYIKELVMEEGYKQFLDEHRYGDKKEDNIGVYQLPDNVPPAFAGLIAGRLTEACDKAIICLTYNEKKGYFTGSGRSPVSNETSLHGFIDEITKNAGEELQIKFGGHEEAIGISSLNDIVLFQQLVEENKDKMIAKDVSDRTFLKINLSEINNEETIAKLKALEPIGMGLKIPPVKLEGTETYRNQGFISRRDDWKRIKLKVDNTNLSVTDWSYSPKGYIQSGKKNNEIGLIAEISINNYKGVENVEFTAKFDRANFLEQAKEKSRSKIKEKGFGNLD